MHKIDFYQIESEQIPTGLRLMVDDEIQVSYHHLHGAFGYHFEINKPMDEETADSIINDIVHVMHYQSYDHGAEWEITKIEHKVQDIFEMKFHNYDVFFRIKDIY